LSTLADPYSLSINLLLDFKILPPFPRNLAIRKMNKQGKNEKEKKRDRDFFDLEV
jgi:hypothetical protein